jgi:hypothetical protein
MNASEWCDLFCIFEQREARIASELLWRAAIQFEQTVPIMDTESLSVRTPQACQETWPKTIFSSFHIFERMVLYVARDATKSWLHAEHRAGLVQRADCHEQGRVARIYEV